ncbi:hypothetical protein KCU71_g5747, partial [Aureobasidium melanogenum]
MTNPPQNLLLHPSSMTLLNHANMDALPLELKQRICSFLTPKELKSLRLTCKVFATAAERYFINRFVLFLHPESLTTLRKIAEHETFSKYLTTIVYDTSGLRSGVWVTSLSSPLQDPCWDDYRPKTLTLNAHESYAALTTRAMHDAIKNFEAAWAEVREYRTRLKELYYYQSSSTSYVTLRTEIEYALKRCPRLRNLVLSSRHPLTVQKAKARILKVPHWDLWWASGRCRPLNSFLNIPALDSLTLFEGRFPILPRIDGIQAMGGLKHLRLILPYAATDFGLYDLHCAFKNMRQLETLSLGAFNCDITRAITALRSNRLRVCLMDFGYVQGDALVDFLLHHAHTLQRLALGLGATDIGWAPVLCSIAGRFLSLKHVQLESLTSRENRCHMRRDAGLQAERFVMSGGLMPLIRYTTLESRMGNYSVPGRGFSIDRSPRGQLPSGLWPEYESGANRHWDGACLESEDDDKKENKNVGGVEEHVQTDEETENENEEDEEDEGDNEDD